jgi:hypothetical protein
MPDITALSLRARLAIALRLFTGYCERRGLAHPEVVAYPEYLRRFITLPGTTEAFGRWEADQPPLIETGLGWDRSLATPGQSMSGLSRLVKVCCLPAARR